MMDAADNNTPRASDPLPGRGPPHEGALLGESSSVDSQRHSDQTPQQQQQEQQRENDAESAAATLLGVSDKAASTSAQSSTEYDPKTPLQLPGPRLLRYSRFRFVTIVLDGLLVLVTVAFLVFGFLVAANDGQHYNSNGSLAPSLLEAASYGPTIFPILFAAIVGRMLKGVATLSIERGSTVGRIEQLCQSSTLFSALTTQIQLRSFNIVGLSLMVLWVFSPLGSRGAFRIIYPAETTQEIVNRVVWLDTQAPYFVGFSMPGGSRTSIRENSVNPAFSSALQYSVLPQGKGTQDLWGNLRIPMVEKLDPSPDGSSTEWIDIPDSSNTTYSSATGVPFALIGSLDKTLFTLNLSYVSLDCPVFGKTENWDYTDYSAPTSPRPRAPYDAWATEGFAMTDTEGLSYDKAMKKVWALAQIASSYCLREPKGEPQGPCYNSSQLESPAQQPARQLTWESKEDQIQKLKSYAECNMHTSYVDVEYSCHLRVCNATRVRRVKKPDKITNRTVFEFDQVTIGDLLRDLGRLFTLVGSGSRTTPLFAYMISPDEAFTLNTIDGHNIIDQGREQFEVRLSQIMNNLHMVGISPLMTLGAQPVAAETPPDGLRTPGSFVHERTAASSENIDIVRCDWTWLAIYMLACFLLLGAAVVSLVVRAMTLGPDILGSLASATLDNRFGESVVGGGSGLDWAEWSRLMKGVEVQMCDVNPEGSFGRIALSARGGQAEKLVRGRLYE